MSRRGDYQSPRLASGHSGPSSVPARLPTDAEIAAADQSYDAYIRAGHRSTSPRDPTAFRVTMVGPRDCGKTCIVRRVFTASTEPYSKNTAPTIGEECYGVDINSQPITVSDLSGDESFLDYIHEILQHTDLLLAVVDASQPLSSISLMARMLKKLLDMQDARPDGNKLTGVCTWLVVNKCDEGSLEWEARVDNPRAKENLAYIRKTVRTSRYREFSICCHGNESLARCSAERLRDAVVAYHTIWVKSCCGLHNLQYSSNSASTATSTNGTPRNNLSRSSSVAHNGSTGALAALAGDAIVDSSPPARARSPRSPGREGGCAMQ
jgi:GTPase SAR1 family protein